MGGTVPPVQKVGGTGTPRYAYDCGVQQQYVFIYECIEHVLNERNKEITMKQNGDVGTKLDQLLTSQ